MKEQVATQTSNQSDFFRFAVKHWGQDPVSCLNLRCTSKSMNEEKRKNLFPTEATRILSAVSNGNYVQSEM